MPAADAERPQPKIHRLTIDDFPETLKEVKRGDAFLAPETSNLDIPAAILKATLSNRVPAAPLSCRSGTCSRTPGRWRGCMRPR